MEPARQTRYIAVERIKRGRYQPRLDFNPEALQSLADSISRNGIIEPIVVRYDHRDDRYELVVGERRWRAVQMIGDHCIEAIVRDDLSDLDVQLMALSENDDREGLNPIERALSYQRLVSEFGLMHKEIAEQTGQSRTQVTNTLRLLTLCADTQDALRKQEIEVGHAKHLMSLPVGWQRDLTRRCVRNDWSVRALAKKVSAVRTLLEGEKEETAPKQNANLRELENRLSAQFGLPFGVTFDELSHRGKITVCYHSLEEAQGLLDAWGVKEHPTD